MNMIGKGNSALWVMMLVAAAVLLSHCTEDPFEPNITGSIEGVVMDSETNDPIRNATITTKPSTEVILTDSSGYYKISAIDTGRYSVVAEKNNYNTKMLGIKIKEGTTAEVNFLLNRSDGKSAANIKFSDDFYPQSGTEDLPTELTLSWNAYNDNGGDSLTYDVSMYTGNTSEEFLSAENLNDTSLTVNSLSFDQLYYWQVIARNEYGDTTHSKLLNFRTMSISNNAFFFVQKIDGNYEIMAYDFDHSVTSRLTYNSHRDWAPKLNDKFNQIAFVSDEEVKPLIYTIDKSGDNLRQVTNIEVDGYHNSGNALAWDTDAGKIIFSHYQHLYEIKSDGTSLQKIATAPAGRHFRECEVSPDGSKIVALTIGDKIYNSEIYLMDRDGSNQQQLIGSLNGIVASPTFSIDGKSILYTHDISGNETLDGRMLNSHIFRLDLATSDTTDLSTNKPLGTNDLTPTYSPTGNKIIFTNVVNDNSQPKEIWMMDIDGSNREKLVDNGELPNWK
jgi:TolB protein